MDTMQETHRRIAFATLGCRLNQFETDALTGDFLRAGWRMVGFDEDAELYVINTCTITGKGEQKSRNLVNRARRREGARVVVTGCSVETAGEYYRALVSVRIGRSFAGGLAKFVSPFKVLHMSKVSACGDQGEVVPNPDLGDPLTPPERWPVRNIDRKH